MTLLHSCTTKVALCVVVFFVASGFATVITVVDPSFEAVPFSQLEPCGSGCFFTEPHTSILGWDDLGDGGFFLPGTEDPFHNTTFFNFVPNGISTAYSNGGTIEQTVGPKVQDSLTYTLTVDLGLRKDTSFDASADILLGGPGGTVIPATGTPPSPGNWSEYTATFTGTAANAGETITIQLVSTGLQGNFDNVHLEVVPEPSSMLLLGSGVLGLAQVLRRRRL